MYAQNACRRKDPDMKINDASRSTGVSRDMIRFYEKLGLVVDKFLSLKMEFTGAIPDDPNCGKAVMQQKPVTLADPGSGATKAIKSIAEKIAALEGGSDKKGIAQLFSRWMKSIYKKKK